VDAAAGSRRGTSCRSAAFKVRLNKSNKAAQPRRTGGLAAKARLGNSSVHFFIIN